MKRNQLLLRFGSTEASFIVSSRSIKNSVNRFIGLTRAIVNDFSSSCIDGIKDAIAKSNRRMATARRQTREQALERFARIRIAHNLRLFSLPTCAKHGNTILIEVRFPVSMGRKRTEHG
jgi:hypothetical protein